MVVVVHSVVCHRNLLQAENDLVTKIVFLIVFQAFFLSYGLGCLTVLDTDEVKQCTLLSLVFNYVHHIRHDVIG